MTHDLARRDARVVWHPYTQHGIEPEPLPVVAARGAWLQLADGRELLDGISSWWATLHGHCHPRIAAAIADQAARLDHVLFAGATHEPAVQLAEELLAIAPAPHPMGGYGMRFREWLNSDAPKPYHSFGNGSAMRVSAVGWAFDTLDDVLGEAERSAAVTHNHPEGIKGAQAVALAVYLARKRATKDDVRREIQLRFGYDLNRTLENIRPSYRFNETCQQTVPEALIAFLESNDFEDAVRKAISLGGDADTLAAITGSIAEAYYWGVPTEIELEVRRRAQPELLNVVNLFALHYA